MVLSTINNMVNYLEQETIDSKDIDHETYIYDGNIYNKNIKFSLGKPNFEYMEEYNIVYFNIYLVTKEDIVGKIGVYETRNTDYLNQLDDDGDIIINNPANPLIPLIFPKSKILIKNNYKSIDSDFEMADSDDDNEDDSDDTDDSDDSDDSDDTDDDSSEEEDKEDTDEDALKEDLKELETPLIIVEQTKEESDAEKEAYTKKDSDVWINAFMRSNRYSIEKTLANGDCLFDTLRIALTKIPIHKGITVKAIREKLVEQVNDEVLETYLTRRNFFLENMTGLKSELKKSNDLHKVLKKRISSSSSTSEKSELLEEAKSNVSSISSASSQQKELNELYSEQGIDVLKDVKTVDDLKNVMRKSSYWADDWAIATLERVYNIKFIIFGKFNFDPSEKENPHVIQCGISDMQLEKLAEKFDRELDGGKLFDPDHYILSEYDGTHYNLITYDKNINKAAFKFKEIPYDVKQKVLDKCLERCAGTFSLIPDFRNLASSCSIDLKKLEPDVKSELDAEVADLKKSLSPKSPSLKKSDPLFDDSIVIQIYRDGRKTGNNKIGQSLKMEKIPLESKIDKKLIDLQKISGWRNKLDDSWIMDDLEIEGIKWASVQHYMFASRFKNIAEVFVKFKKNSPEKAGHDIKESKLLYDSIMKNKSYSQAIKSYEKEFLEKESSILYNALTAKFSNEEFAKILFLTKDAKIIIFVAPRKPAIEATELMKVRQQLLKK